MTFITAPQTPHITVERWRREQRALHRSERTVTERARTVYRFAALAEVDPLALTADHILDVLAAQSTSAASTQTYLAQLRAWFHWCEQAELRTGDPTLRVGTPTVATRQPRPIGDAHAAVLSQATGLQPATRAKIMLGMYAGLRVSEIAKIQGQDFDLIARELTVIGKGGKHAVLPLHPLLVEVAASMPRRGWWFPSPTRQGPISRTSCSDGIRRAMHRLGVPGSGHQLRHWFATALLAGGADVRVVQTLMRHGSLSTTAIYTLVSDGQQRAALDGLPLFAWADAA